MTEEERNEKLLQAKKRFLKPFITDIPVKRTTFKSFRLLQIESKQKASFFNEITKSRGCFPLNEET